MDNELKELVAELNDLPEQIYNLKMGIFDSEESLQMTKESRDSIRDDVWYEVSSEVDDNGKAVYSNEQKRSLEVSRRLSTNAEYIELTQSLKFFEATVYQKRALLEKLLDVQSNKRILISIISK